MVVVGADLVAGLRQVISKDLTDRIPDRLLGRSVDRHEYDRGCGLRSFDPFRVIVGYSSRRRRDAEHLRHVLLAEPRHRADAHRAPVAEAVVRLGILLRDPHAEVDPVSCEGIPAPVLLHGIDQRLLHRLLVGVDPAVHERLRHCEGHNAVVRELGPLGKELKIRRLNVILIKFVGASYDIPQNSAIHNPAPFFTPQARTCGSPPRRRRAHYPKSHSQPHP